MPERRRPGAAVVALFLLSSCLLSLAALAQGERPAAPPAPTPVAEAPPAALPALRIGTNLVAGLYYPAGGALCRVAARASGMRCLVESTNGSTANIRGLLAGNLEFGIVQSDWQYHAVQGSATFREKGPVKALRAVMALHGEPFTLIVRPDSGIESFEQIRGKRLAPGPADSGPRILFDVLVAALGWRAQDAGTVSDAAPDEAARAFCAGEIDAVFLMGNHPNALAQKLVRGCDGMLLPVAGPAVDKVVAERGYYAPASIPAGIYGPDQAEVATLGVRATLVTVEEVPADLVYGFVRAVMENLADLTGQHPGLAGLRREEMPGFGLTAPLHEGALRYYREVGLVR